MVIPPCRRNSTAECGLESSRARPDSNELPEELGSHLDAAGSAAAGNRSYGAAGDVRVGTPWVEVIERAERLCPQLEVVTLLPSEVRVLKQRQVGDVGSRVANIGKQAAHVAEGECGRLREHRRVEPLRQLLVHA